MRSAPTRRGPGRSAQRLAGIALLIVCGVGVALTIAELAVRGVEWLEPRLLAEALVRGLIDLPARCGLPMARSDG
jgi:hypothetical protein